MNQYFIYILKCADNSYYVGSTCNLEKRVYEHNHKLKPCTTSTKLPVTLVYADSVATQEEARAAEFKIKKWSRAKKEALIRGDWDDLSRLSERRHKSTDT